jgi:hypothetical protein
MHLGEHDPVELPPGQVPWRPRRAGAGRALGGRFRAERRDEIVPQVDRHPAGPHGMRTDLEMAAIVLAVAGSTFSACVLAVTALLASYVIRTLCAGCLGGLRGPRSGRM